MRPVHPLWDLDDLRFALFRVAEPARVVFAVGAVILACLAAAAN